MALTYRRDRRWRNGTNFKRRSRTVSFSLFDAYDPGLVRYDDQEADRKLQMQVAGQIAKDSYRENFSAEKRPFRRSPSPPQAFYCP